MNFAQTQPFRLILKGVLCGLAVALLFIFFSPLNVQAANGDILDTKSPALPKAGLEEIFKSGGADKSKFIASEKEGEEALAEAIGTVIKTFLQVVGVIFLILLIVGGALWMTARGNDEQVTKAKKLITSTVIGLIIILLSFAITDFVVRRLTAAQPGDKGFIGPVNPPL